MRRLLRVLCTGGLLLGSVVQTYGQETLHGKRIALGSAGIPYVVGGTAQENWEVQNRQHLEDAALLADHAWPELPNLADRMTQPVAVVPVVVIVNRP